MVQRTALGPGRYLAGPTHLVLRSVPPLCADSSLAFAVPPPISHAASLFFPTKKKPACLVFLRPRALTPWSRQVTKRYPLTSNLRSTCRRYLPSLDRRLGHLHHFDHLYRQRLPTRPPSHVPANTQHPASSQAVPFASHRIASHRVCFSRVLSRPRINDDILDD